MPVHADRLVPRDAVEKFQLEGFVRGLVMGAGAGAVPDLGADRIAGGDDLFHARFDGAQILGREGLGAVEVVEPALIADRADGDLDVRPELLHGAGHDMGQVVSDQFQRRFGILHRVDGDLARGIDRPGQIDMRAIKAGRNRVLGKAGGDGGRDLGGGDAGGIVARIAIGEGEGDLGHESPPRRFGAHGTPGCGLCVAGMWRDCRALSMRLGLHGGLCAPVARCATPPQDIWDTKE
jgi:hypothetical protein